jgi:hypothetical protein
MVGIPSWIVQPVEHVQGQLGDRLRAPEARVEHRRPTAQVEA